ncbi:hypothetical protein JVT61DRAFT_12343 [Boletus reticuloceps]|uniref:Uncharacterized protein n=1 Tax=Boletus reticuloceps TaxID=495285 RepID=A0A8I2YE14_9AGAM|nr:hypothetical protein JVT61DRAFT_12343 [Boletus reticuloceps]
MIPSCLPPLPQLASAAWVVKKKKEGGGAGGGSGQVGGLNPCRSLRENILEFLFFDIFANTTNIPASYRRHLRRVVTHLLFDTYPDLRVGPSAKICALVVGNATLASISRRYELKPYTTEAYTRHERIFFRRGARVQKIDCGDVDSPAPHTSPSACIRHAHYHLALFNQQLQKRKPEVEWVYNESDGEVQ